jgi:DNA-binding response OmpR family regulator
MKFLVIDDDANITEMLQTYFESKKIQCLVTNNGKEGLEIIRKEKLDAIILDLKMPKFSGFNVFDQLKRENLIRKNTVIVFTAAKTYDKSMRDMQSSGVKRVIRKPCSLIELEAEINQVTRHHKRFS